MKRPNFIVILIDDLRYDEFGAGGHPYMKTPHIDRIAHEGAIFERAFHTTPICSPNRALDHDRPVREPPRHHR
jgi:N-acetylglucosamine-6-sulfatase